MWPGERLLGPTARDGGPGYTTSLRFSHGTESGGDDSVSTHILRLIMIVGERNCAQKLHGAAVLAAQEGGGLVFSPFLLGPPCAWRALCD